MIRWINFTKWCVNKVYFTPKLLYSTKRSVEEGRKFVISRTSGSKEDLWKMYNEVIYPPLDEKSNDGCTVSYRPAEVTNRMTDILYSEKKLWLLGYLISGISVDAAFAQLAYRHQKGARILEQLLEQTVEMAVQNHDFEFNTKIWVESVRVTRGESVGRVHRAHRNYTFRPYHYSTVCIRLVEGDPPKKYHPTDGNRIWTPAGNCPPEGRRGWHTEDAIVDMELRRLRRRRIIHAL